MISRSDGHRESREREREGERERERASERERERASERERENGSRLTIERSFPVKILHVSECVRASGGTEVAVDLD